MGVWAVGLSVLSMFTQLEYFAKTDNIGPHLVGVVMSWIIRFPFLIFVVFRLKRTPEPVAGADAFFTGLGGRSTVIQWLAAAALLWQTMYLISFLTAGVWVGVITATLWMTWIYGMTVREQARCYQLYKNRLSGNED
jgi:hypothetical protein